MSPMLWLLVVLAIGFVVGTAVTATLAVTQRRARAKWIRWSVLSLVLTVATIAVASISFDDAGGFENDLVENMGNDAFIGSLVSSTSK